LFRAFGLSVPSEFREGIFSVATSPFDSKTTKRPLALISLANEVNWKAEPLAGEDVSCTTYGSGVELAIWAETDCPAPTAIKSAEIAHQVRKTCFTEKASEK